MIGRTFCVAVLFTLGVATLAAQDVLPVRWNYEDLNVAKPHEAADHGLEGTVMVWVRVDKYGHVKESRIVRSMSDPLDSAVIGGVRSMRFKPMAINGKAVDNGEAFVEYAFGGYYGGHGLDQYEHAIGNYTKLLELPVHTIGAIYYTERYYGRGRVHFINGDLKAAKTDFDIARSRGCTLPWYATVQHNLVDPLLPRDTTSRDSLMRYAKLLHTYQLTLEAIPMFERILSRFGERSDVIFSLARCYRDVRDHQKAWDMYRWLVQSGDTTKVVLVNAAWAAYLARDDRSAVDLGDQLIERWPEDENVLGNYGLALLNLDRKAEAVAIYEMIRDLNGGYMYIVVNDLKRHIGVGFPGKDTAREILARVFGIPRDYIP